MSKLLVVRPDASRLGGIETYFSKLFPHLKVSFQSFGIAQRPSERGLVDRVSRIIGDYCRYWNRLSDPEIEIVHLNPSLEPRSFYREALFLLLARLRRKKTLVFIHGWSTRFEKSLDRLGGRLFRLLYGRADAYVVLAAAFFTALRRWGIDQPIYSEVTIIEDEVVPSEVQSLFANRLSKPSTRLLFASRLLPSKGIITTLRAMHVIQRTHPHFELVVAGDGEVASAAQDLAEQLQIRNIAFLGAVHGFKKYEVFRDAHILCFPTEHPEGFPNIIVEAMALGLPIVTRPVGGISDFFQNGMHGYLTESTEPQEIARLILLIATDQGLYQRMAEASYCYARTHFLASDAARRIERIYASLSTETRPNERDVRRRSYL